MALTLMLPAGSCVSGQLISGDAICAGTRASRAEHAAALAVTTDDRVALTGARLVTQIDAGCAG